ncbi:hypothetical protein [Candidatus Nitrosocosmicus franklandus]|uniref:Uncharacterized protein n=1 Tax=Candidatus Nitrosocosmicus franklandianus TaxID=1798806 RepID=A0A484IJB0_9ARCH|nr:hypothetical protein [Candidatus Nitrosocosmicus franklandus]VFJ14978.1 conserved protein of unknown function [Candidatus Nitrosocosmicus franklandus]
MGLHAIEKAGELADQVSIAVKKSSGSLVPVYYKLEEILVDYRKRGMDVDLVMPALFEVDLEHNRTIPDGRSIWVAYADVLHDDLCHPSGSIHNLVKSGGSITGTSLIQLILEKLKLPESSALLIAPIAASILGLGVNAFCMHHKEDENNS